MLLQIFIICTLEHAFETLGHILAYPSTFIIIFLIAGGNHAFVDALRESPGSIVVCVICFFSMWSILGLAGFHTVSNSPIL